MNYLIAVLYVLGSFLFYEHTSNKCSTDLSPSRMITTSALWPHTLIAMAFDKDICQMVRKEDNVYNGNY